jgi:hypothetical protein
MAKERSRILADRKTVPLPKVAALFRQNYKQGPWPSEAKCYRLANAIEIVLNASPPKANNDDPGSLNYRDLMIAWGQYPIASDPPPIAVADGAGEVIAVGPQVTRFKGGDHVAIPYYPDWMLELAER